MKIAVRLTLDELHEAATAGMNRRIGAIERRRRNAAPSHTATNLYEWEQHVRGAIAEYAVCKAFGMPFSGFVDAGIRQLADAGPLEVRTIMKPDATLVAKAKDVDHQKLVLTLVKDDRVLIPGWSTAGVVREFGWANQWGTHSLAQQDLYRMDEIGLPIQWSQHVREYKCLQDG